jgi:hypothetical protein
MTSSKDLANEMFLLDEDIRWVGVVDQQGEIMQNVQRPGVESLTDVGTEELTLREFPTIMGLFWRDLIGRSGKLLSVVVAYTRVYLFAFYHRDLLIVLSFEPRGMPRVVQKLEARFGPLQPTSPRQSSDSTYAKH